MFISSPLVTVIIGTRPEAIKLAPVIKELLSESYFNVRVVLTGQHKELVNQVLTLFSIEADNNLNIMSERQTLSDITKRTLIGLEKEFEKYTPKLVLVQGDTSTAFVSALAAFYKKIKVGHIEAGLRTNNIYDPFPEEVNRRLISQIAYFHFAPTEISHKNLLDSNVQGKVIKTGNTVIDALKIISEKVSKINFFDGEFKNNKLILLTVHRRENRGKKLKEIADGILLILSIYKDVNFLIPLHPNPTVNIPLREMLGSHPRINLCKPLDYFEIVSAMKYCYFVMTDSGGIQEEAPSLGKPVLVIRDTTERPEGIQAGTTKLIGTKTKDIFEQADILLKDESIYRMMSKAINPYGDGLASSRIIAAFKSEFLISDL